MVLLEGLGPFGGDLQHRVSARASLAGILTVARDKKRPSNTDDLLHQVQLVAGARNQLYLEFTWTAAYPKTLAN